MIDINPIRDERFRGWSQMRGKVETHSLTSLTHILQ